MATHRVDARHEELAAVQLRVDTVPDPASLGGKAASLARLIAAGLPVPTTGVVTTSAYRCVASAQSIHDVVARVGGIDAPSDDEIESVFLAAEIPGPTAEMIAAVASDVGGTGRIAVRSSATVEDLGGASFAGQYRSFLDIDSDDQNAVLDAVRRVWASLWFAAPTAYRRTFGLENGTIEMAVVLMQMVPADHAGVVFTADPAGSGGARVEAVEGLGESLVSGERTPHAWVVTPEDESELPEHARSALSLSRRIERLEGVPQDVEWATAGGETWIVQARPITVAADDDGFDSPLDDHLLTTAGIGEMVPGVVPALLWELNRFLLEESYRSVFDDLDMMSGASTKPLVRRVRGRMAIDFDGLRAVAATIPDATQQLEIEYFGGAESSGASPDRNDPSSGRVRRRLRALERQVRSARSRQRVIGQADVVIETVALLWPRRPVLSAMTPEALLAHVARLVDLAARGLAAELGVAATSASAFERLGHRLRTHLGPDVGAVRTQEMISGIGLERTRDPDASAAIFAGPTWRELERSGRVDLPAESSRPHGLLHDDRVAALRREFVAIPGWKRTRILTGQLIDVRWALVRQQIDEVVNQLRRREAAKAAVLQIGGEVRRVHHHLGTRLHLSGLIPRIEDVELLTTGELARAAVGNGAPSAEALRRRRRWIDRYETEGVLPLRFVGAPDRTPAPMPNGDRLDGWGASPGRAAGRAQLVRSPTDGLEAGAILVAEATDASWSPLFLRASAVVVERGGPLSHAAILARELGLPAVLNVPGACVGLDGREVLVDGTEGLVVIEPEKEP